MSVFRQSSIFSCCCCCYCCRKEKEINTHMSKRSGIFFVVVCKTLNSIIFCLLCSISFLIGFYFYSHLQFEIVFDSILKYLHADSIAVNQCGVCYYSLFPFRFTPTFLLFSSLSVCLSSELSIAILFR